MTKDKEKEKEAEKATVRTVDRRTVEAWRDALNTPAWQFAAARAKHAWPTGYQVTQTHYERAITTAASEVIR